MNADILTEIELLKNSIASLQEKIDIIANMTEETRGLVGPFGVPMPNDKMLVQTIHGNKYLIDPNDHVMAPQLIVYRQWEPELSWLFVNECNSDTVFVDVGANFGYFSCLAASKIGTNGRGQVFSIEPNPKLVDLLRINTQINWSMAPVHIYAAAAGNAEGDAILSIPESGAANASLTDSGMDSERVKVSVKRIDDIVPPDIIVDIMKIDVEGHEAGVLSGARQTIHNSRNIKIIMEWSTWQIQAAGYTIDDMTSLMSILDLRAFDAETKIELSHNDLKNIQYSNILLEH